MDRRRQHGYIENKLTKKLKGLIFMKIEGLKQAVGDYKRANAGGWYSPIYGKLMFDKADGEIWTDQFCSLGHNEWKVYHSDTVINLGAMMAEEDIPVTMANVKQFIADNNL